MANLDPIVNDIRHLYNKVAAVINSCETLDQLECAEKYAMLAIRIWVSKYPESSLLAQRHRNMVNNIVNRLEDLLKIRRIRIRKY